MIIEADVGKQLVCTLYVAFRTMARTWPRTAVIICSARNTKLMTAKFSFLLPLDVPANGTAWCKGVDQRALLFTATAGSLASLCRTRLWSDRAFNKPNLSLYLCSQKQFVFFTSNYVEICLRLHLLDCFKMSSTKKR
jgi:hypothetical protein